MSDYTYTTGPVPGLNTGDLLLRWPCRSVFTPGSGFNLIVVAAWTTEDGKLWVATLGPNGESDVNPFKELQFDPKGRSDG